MPLFSPADSHSFHNAHLHGSAHPAASSSPPAFFFRRRTGKLNWSQLSSVSLSSIISTVNVDLLQEHVELITYADINESDLAAATDGQIVHLIRLAQLTLEYLLNVQNYLLRLQRQKQRTYLHVTHEMERAKALLKDKDDQILQLQQENKFLKKLNKHLQASPGSSPIKAAAPTVTATSGVEVSVHTCEYCRASFVSEMYLAGHIGRRHPEMVGRRARKHKQHSEGSSDSDDSASSHRRRRKEEEDKLRAELQRQRDELELERKKLQAERERPPTPKRPAPIQTFSPEWLEGYTRDIEKRVREETIAAVKASGGEVSEQVKELQQRLDSVLKGAIPISPSSPQVEQKPTGVTKEELLKEIAQLKQQHLSPRPQHFIPSPAPSSPSPMPQSPSPSPMAVVDAHRVKKYQAFSEFPSLLSRFQHEESDLQRRVEAFSRAVEGMGGEEGGEWMRKAEGGGYDFEEREVREDVERIAAGYVDHRLEERWNDVLERESQLEARRQHREDRRREKERANQQAQAERAQQIMLQQQQFERERAEAARREQLQQQQAAISSLPQVQAAPQSFSAQPQSFHVQSQSQSSTFSQPQQPTVQPVQPVQAPVPSSASSLMTTDVDALLRRQQEQAGVVDELRRKLQPNQPTQYSPPSSFKVEVEEEKTPALPMDPSPSIQPTEHEPLSRPVVEKAKEEMSEEEPEDVQPVQLEPQSPMPLEEKEEKDDKPKTLSPIKRVGGGFMLSAQRGTLPALVNRKPLAPLPASSASVSASAVSAGVVPGASAGAGAAFSKPSAGFFNDSQELELEEEEF